MTAGNREGRYIYSHTQTKSGKKKKIYLPCNITLAKRINMKRYFGSLMHFWSHSTLMGRTHVVASTALQQPWGSFSGATFLRINRWTSNYSPVLAQKKIYLQSWWQTFRIKYIFKNYITHTRKKQPGLRPSHLHRSSLLSLYSKRDKGISVSHDHGWRWEHWTRHQTGYFWNTFYGGLK